jgi:hypothetical protein
VDDPGATSTITSTKTGNPTISVHDENGAEGPLVRIHATGSARVRLLELVKTLVSGENVEKQKEVLSKDAIVQCVAEDAVAEEGEETIAMDVDVFGSRPNFDPRQKSKRKNHMEKTLGMFLFPSTPSQFILHVLRFLSFFLSFSQQPYLI